MARQLDVGVNFKAKLENKQAIDDLQKRLQRVGDTMTRVGKTLSLTLTAPIIALQAIAIKSFGEQEKALAKVRSGIKSTGGAARLSLEQLTKAASDLQSATTFGDEDILGGATASLLTFTKVSGDVFIRAQKAVVDLSAKMGIDLQSSALQVGKALNDPITGLSILNRAGIQFTDSQKDLIKVLVETNRLADAQGIILKELETQFGGTAAAIAKTGTGPLTQFKNLLGDVLEQFGAIAFERINPFIELLSSLAKRLSETSDATKSTIVAIAGFAASIGPVLIIAGELVENFAPLLAVITKFAVPVTIMVSAFSVLVTGIVLAEKRLKTFSTTFSSISKIIKPFLSNFFKVTDITLTVANAFNVMGEVAQFLGRVLADVVNNVFQGFILAVAQLAKGFVTLAKVALSIPGADLIIPASVFEAVQNLSDDLDELQEKAIEDLVFVGESKVEIDSDEEIDKFRKKLAALNKEVEETVLRPEADSEPAITELNKILVTGEQIRNSIAGGFANTFVAFVNGTKTAAEAFKDFANGVINDILRIATRQLILNSLGSAFGATPAAATGGLVVGGSIARFGSGGPVRGPGTGTSDSITARLSNGEFVLKEAAASKLGLANLQALNNLDFSRFKLPSFSTGGLVNAIGTSFRGAARFRDGGMVGGGMQPVSVNIENNGSSKQVASSEASFDGQGIVLNILLEDIGNNGKFSQNLQGTFGLSRK